MGHCGGVDGLVFASRRWINSIVHVTAEIRSFIRASLIDPVKESNEETAAPTRRRRIVVAISLVLGATALGAALNVEPGEPRFYFATLGVAAIWTIGALASGPLSRGRAWTRHGTRAWRTSAVHGFILGGALLAVFLVGATVVGQIELLREPVDDLLEHALYGSIAIVAVITAVNGVCEELFFRGAVFAAMPRRWAILGSSLIYALSTVFSGVPLLTFAAVCLGLLAGAQRRVTGGVLGPIVTHLTWSLGMLYLLPYALSIGDLLW